MNFRPHFMKTVGGNITENFMCISAIIIVIIERSLLFVLKRSQIRNKWSVFSDPVTVRMNPSTGVRLHVSS